MTPYKNKGQFQQVAFVKNSHQSSESLKTQPLFTTPTQCLSIKQIHQAFPNKTHKLPIFFSPKTLFQIYTIYLQLVTGFDHSAENAQSSLSTWLILDSSLSNTYFTSSRSSCRAAHQFQAVHHPHRLHEVPQEL